MPFTADILVEVFQAVNEQMERCPGCHGVGRVRQSGDYQACFCLVCEEIAKAMYHLNCSWVRGYKPRIDAEKIYDSYKEQFDRVLIEAREFGKRCPGCLGIRKVWAGDRPRKCFVCERLHIALDAYEQAVNPAGPVSAPMPYTSNAGGMKK